MTLLKFIILVVISLLLVVFWINFQLKKSVPSNEEYKVCFQLTNELNSIIRNKKNSCVQKEYPSLCKYDFHAARWSWENNTCCIYIECDHVYENLYDVVKDIKKIAFASNIKTIKITLNFHYNDECNKRVIFYTNSYITNSSADAMGPGSVGPGSDIHIFTFYS